jgi:hypothetical protein
MKKRAALSFRPDAPEPASTPATQAYFMKKGAFAPVL